MVRIRSWSFMVTITVVASRCNICCYCFAQTSRENEPNYKKRLTRRMFYYSRLRSHCTGRIFDRLKILTRYFVHKGPSNARTKQKQQTNGNRAIWLAYRTDTNARGFWLVKPALGWKNFMPENFLEINRYFALTLYCNSIGQSNKGFSMLRFSFAGKRRVYVLIFFIHSRSFENRSIFALFTRKLEQLGV